MCTKKKVLVGLSGGVDSSTTAYILKSQGYDVTGIFFIMSDDHCALVEGAQKCADHLNIPLIVKDMKTEFEKHVISPFMEGYSKGLTPNPCIKCNPKVKFKELLNYVNQNGFDFIATGHYAEIININGRYTIKTPKAENRDQTYMLYALSQDVLSKMILPLSQYSKDEVREIARKIGLPSADTKASQDICFVKNKTYSEYIESRLGKSKIGNFISPEGKIIGKHKGIVHYTIGQRKGLGVALGKPCFIKSINEETGDIQLAFEGDNLISQLNVKDINYTLIEDLKEKMDVLIKIRSTAKLVKGVISKKNDDELLVEFNDKQTKPSAGQAIVFYNEDNLLVGGGVIQK